MGYRNLRKNCGVFRNELRGFFFGDGVILLRVIIYFGFIDINRKLGIINFEVFY